MPCLICQTFAHDPSPTSQKQQILSDLGFAVQKLEDEMDLHPDEPALRELAFLMLAVQNGSETCQAQLPLHRWDHLALQSATPSQYKAVVVKVKSLLCMSELHVATLVHASSTLIAKIQSVLQWGNLLDHS